MGYNLNGASYIQSGIVIDGINVDDHSLQAMIELIYIDAGNEIMVSNMVNLDRALDASKQSIDILQQLQVVKNQLTVTSRQGPFEFDAGGDDEDALDEFNEAASDYFGTPLTPEVTGDIGQAWETIEQITPQLDDLLAYLEESTPEADRQNPNSLYQRLLTVKNELPASEGDVEAWILDNYDKYASEDSSTAGALQKNITFAMNAAQSYNDSQKEAVNRYLFVFEEYYKSAGAILQKINEIITHMAQNVAR